jgi:hypothetical protein
VSGCMTAAATDLRPYPCWKIERRRHLCMAVGGCQSGGRRRVCTVCVVMSFSLERRRCCYRARIYIALTSAVMVVMFWGREVTRPRGDNECMRSRLRHRTVPVQMVMQEKPYYLLSATDAEDGGPEGLVLTRGVARMAIVWDGGFLWCGWSMRRRRVSSCCVTVFRGRFLGHLHDRAHLATHPQHLDEYDTPMHNSTCNQSPQLEQASARARSISRGADRNPHLYIYFLQLLHFFRGTTGLKSMDILHAATSCVCRRTCIQDLKIGPLGAVYDSRCSIAGPWGSKAQRVMLAQEHQGECVHIPSQGAHLLCDSSGGQPGLLC